MPGQTVELFDEVEEHSEPRVPEAGGTEFGQFGDGRSDVTGRMCGKDLAMVSTSPGGMPRTAPTSRMA